MNTDIGYTINSAQLFISNRVTENPDHPSAALWSVNSNNRLVTPAFQVVYMTDKGTVLIDTASPETKITTDSVKKAAEIGYFTGASSAFKKRGISNVKGPAGAASASASASGGLEMLTISYRNLTDDEILESVMNHLQVKVESGNNKQKYMIIYSSGLTGGREYKRAQADTELAKATFKPIGSGKHAALLSKISQEISDNRDHEKLKGLIFAAPISFASEFVESNYDSRSKTDESRVQLQYFKNKMDQGYCILLIQNEDSEKNSDVYVGAYGLDNTGSMSVVYEDNDDGNGFRAVHQDLKAIVHHARAATPND